MKEIWKDIEGYEGCYQVSNLGNVRSLDRIIGNALRKGKILKELKNKDGYLVVGLHKDGKRKKFFMHRLVAQAFIPNPDNKKEVNHMNICNLSIDENKKYNAIENLEWTTHDENLIHSYSSGLRERKLTDEEVQYIKNNYKPRDKEFGRPSLAKRFGVSESHIGNIAKGRRGKVFSNT